ncbi:hypothetical protein NMY22_g18102 [Coprinellus aureogranulatus]|nr:hypothetical protein NMY22_g18102 [Coprinellus aureogranulatus]
MRAVDSEDENETDPGLYALPGSPLNASVIAPKVFNGKEDLVHPKDYDRLPSEVPVIAEVSICCWDLTKYDRFVTHLRLERMELLDQSITYIVPTRPSTPTPAPKRKAEPSSEQKRPTKKRTTPSSASTASSSTASSSTAQDEAEGGNMEVEEEEDL